MVHFCYLRPYVGHWNCFLLSVAKDGHGLKLEKAGYACRKSPNKLLLLLLFLL